LIKIYGNGRDEKIRSLVLRLHNYAQTRPDAEGWLARQIGKFFPPPNQFNGANGLIHRRFQLAR
jgi:hypothetical protein